MTPISIWKWIKSDFPTFWSHVIIIGMSLPPLKNEEIFVTDFYFQWMCWISISSCLCPETYFGLYSESWARSTKCMLPRTHFQYWFEMLLQWCPSRSDQWSTMSMSEIRLQHNLNHVIHFDSATYGQFGQFLMPMTQTQILSLQNEFLIQVHKCHMWHLSRDIIMWHVTHTKVTQMSHDISATPGPFLAQT